MTEDERDFEQKRNIENTVIVWRSKKRDRTDRRLHEEKEKMLRTERKRKGIKNLLNVDEIGLK